MCDNTKNKRFLINIYISSFLQYINNKFSQISIRNKYMEVDVSVNVRMKPELKRQFKKFCADMGLSMTEAVNLLAQRAICEYKNPELTKEDNTLMIDEIKALVSKLVKNIKQNIQFFLVPMLVVKPLKNLR